MTIGYTMGVFDMYNVGHLNILKQAKEQCDYLIVGVSTDELCEQKKHKKPIIPFENRYNIIKSVRYVDKAIIHSDNYIQIWKNYHFHKIFVGHDCHDFPQQLEFNRLFTTLGVKIIYLSHTNDLLPLILRNPILPSGAKIGYTQGCYDLFHIGHLNLLKRAKASCDYLIVGVNSDELIYTYKHKRTRINQNDRLTIIDSLYYVNATVLCTTLNKYEMCKQLHFNEVYIGDDWKGNDRWIQTEKDLISLNCKVVYLPHTAGISSTMLRHAEQHKVVD